MRVNRKRVKDPAAFFQKMDRDPEIRVVYEEERAKTKIAFAVREARLRAGLTQTELAKKIGTTQSVIARLEGGADQRIPSMSLLARIAGACGGRLEVGFTFKRAA